MMIICVLLLILFNPVLSFCSEQASAQFMWSGAITTNSANVRAKTPQEGAIVRLAVSEQPDLSGALFSQPDTALTAVNNMVVSLSATGLIADRQYYYAIEINSVLDLSLIGKFRTFPVVADSFTIALGSCAVTGSSHPVFETIRTLQPLFFMHMGDFHYQNISVNDRALFRQAYETVLASPTQSRSYREVPIDYIWDDHDFGPNNSDSTAPGRLASRLTYQEYVPHYPLPAGVGDVPPYHAFSVGRVRFIVTDCRSARSPYSAPDNAAKTMLGATQKAWFKQELVAAQASSALIVWVNSLPWIGVTGDDGWYLYTTERRELADFIKANGILNLCVVSGDAHMLAIDNGANSDYALGGGACFPLMQAAALDRSPSLKGGPYSEGAFPGTGQFGLMTVVDRSGVINVNWSGRNYLNQEIVHYSFVPGDCHLCCHGTTGNIDGSSGDIVDSSDIFTTVDYLTLSAPVSTCMQENDVNIDGILDIGDLMALVDYLIGIASLPPCP